MTEFVENGSLRDYLVKQTDSIPWPLYLKMAVDISNGMQYLHDLQILHRDLKSRNLLVDKHMNVKVCDFGLAKAINKDQTVTGPLGTVAWMVPWNSLNNDLTYRLQRSSITIFIQPSQTFTGTVQCCLQHLKKVSVLVSFFGRWPPEKNLTKASTSFPFQFW